MDSHQFAGTVSRSNGNNDQNSSESQNNDSIHPKHSPSVATISDPSSNPLFIHTADHAGINLVSSKLTGLKNFSTWRRSMVWLLDCCLGMNKKIIAMISRISMVKNSNHVFIPDYLSLLVPPLVMITDSIVRRYMTDMITNCDGSCHGALISASCVDEVLTFEDSSRSEVVGSSDHCTNEGENSSVHLAFGICLYHLGVTDPLSVSMVCKSLYTTGGGDLLLWKLVHGDVFRPVSILVLISAVVGVNGATFTEVKSMLTVEAHKVSDGVWFYKSDFNVIEFDHSLYPKRMLDQELPHGFYYKLNLIGSSFVCVRDVVDAGVIKVEITEHDIDRFGSVLKISSWKVHVHPSHGSSLRIVFGFTDTELLLFSSVCSTEFSKCSIGLLHRLVQVKHCSSVCSTELSK